MLRVSRLTAAVRKSSQVDSCQVSSTVVLIWCGLRAGNILPAPVSDKVFVEIAISFKINRTLQKAFVVHKY